MAEFEIVPEKSEHAEHIKLLYEKAFGPGRFARTAYRVREGHSYKKDLSLVALSGIRVTGTLRFSSISIGDRSDTLLLGPLAVDPIYVGEGIGRTLVKEGLALSCSAGYGLVILVGDLEYYQPLGFTRTRLGQLKFPGPVDPMRILAYQCRENILENCSGLIIARS